jgi:hypothetical protein
VPSGSFANAIVVLYSVSALLGAVLYLPFRVDIRPDLERAGHWQALAVTAIRMPLAPHWRNRMPYRREFAPGI